MNSNPNKVSASTNPTFPTDAASSDKTRSAFYCEALTGSVLYLSLGPKQPELKY